jgi:hypothetical protein
MPNPNIAIGCTSMFEWYVVRHGYKNGHLEDMCSEDVGLRLQNMQAILGSLVNMIGGTYTTT